MNKETLKNAYQRFEEEGIVTVAKSRDDRVPPTLKLAREWTLRRDGQSGMMIAEGKLWEFAELISQFRREGKNRRDGATVRNRVLSLADLVGRQLSAEAVSGARQPAEPDTGTGKKRRRKMAQTRARL